jgi:hypothetical protein
VSGKVEALRAIVRLRRSDRLLVDGPRRKLLARAALAFNEAMVRSERREPQVLAQLPGHRSLADDPFASGSPNG